MHHTGEGPGIPLIKAFLWNRLRRCLSSPRTRVRVQPAPYLRRVWPKSLEGSRDSLERRQRGCCEPFGVTILRGEDTPWCTKALFAVQNRICGTKVKPAELFHRRMITRVSLQLPRNSNSGDRWYLSWALPELRRPLVVIEDLLEGERTGKGETKGGRRGARKSWGEGDSPTKRERQGV